MKRSRAICFALTLGALLAAGAGTADEPLGTATPEMTMTPNPASILVGDSLVVTVAIDTAGNAVRSGGTRILYDDSLLTFVSATVDNATWDDQRIANGLTSGEVDLVGVATADRTGALAFATVTFSAVAPGSTTLDFSDNVNITNINDSGGLPIAGLVATDGSVTISSPSAVGDWLMYE